MFFEKRIDRRARQAMVEFLSGHFRYHTMNSWNRVTSYANCIKINNLGLTSKIADRAYEILQTDFWSSIESPIVEFTAEQGHAYTIGTNGRSGGYLVLYQSYREPTGYKSFCRTCGQHNFGMVVSLADGPESIIGGEILRSGGSWVDRVYLDQSAVKALQLPEAEKLQLIHRLKADLKYATLTNRCGRCNAEGEGGRVNFATTQMKLSVRIGRSIDQDEDFSTWSMSDLRGRVDLVVAFDRACDDIRDEFIYLAENYQVVEETVMVPRKVSVLQPISTEQEVLE